MIHTLTERTQILTISTKDRGYFSAESLGADGSRRQESRCLRMKDRETPRPTLRHGRPCAGLTPRHLGKSETRKWLRVILDGIHCTKRVGNQPEPRFGSGRSATLNPQIHARANVGNSYDHASRNLLQEMIYSQQLMTVSIWFHFEGVGISYRTMPTARRTRLAYQTLWIFIRHFL